MNNLIQMTSTQGDFFTRLRAAHSTLSPKTLAVARFVEAHYLDAAFMSTRELAEAAGVSLATVVRFPRALGYRDFDALRAALQDQVNIDLTGVERLQSLPSGNTSSAALLRRIIDEEMETLRALAHNFSEAQFERFVDNLHDAQQVVILGFRYVAPLADYLAYSLNKIRPGIEVYTQADSTLYDRIAQLEDTDIVLGIGFARYPSDLIHLLHFAHARDRRILCITDSTLSPLLPLAHVSLFSRGTIQDFVGSLAAPGALINCIASELGRRLGDKAMSRLAAAEKAAQAGGIYAGGKPPARTGDTWRKSILRRPRGTQPERHNE
ncbi:MAG: MurR/RpiR family transcriptional regulator [Acidihalobacter sp.]|uniref:MurR/RpiR family transcriptional regulator n=1 Tax=Acidihalobacter sp. TaxID=1872108 RepID=UPI00307E4AFA